MHIPLVPYNWCLVFNISVIKVNTTVIEENLVPSSAKDVFLLELIIILPAWSIRPQEWSILPEFAGEEPTRRFLNLLIISVETF